jgi:hypothetical protein
MRLPEKYKENFDAIGAKALRLELLCYVWSYSVTSGVSEILQTKGLHSYQRKRVNMLVYELCFIIESLREVQLLKQKFDVSSKGPLLVY